MNKGLNVHSEIGALKKGVRPSPRYGSCKHEGGGFSTAFNVTTRVLSGLCPEEHDQFTDLLRGAGAEVVYMEELLAETFDKS